MVLPVACTVHEAKATKAKGVAEKKSANAQKKSESKAAALEYGAAIVGALKDSSHVMRLTVPQMHAALMFKAVTVPKAAKKAELQSLMSSALSLPTAEPPPSLALPAPPAEVAGPSHDASPEAPVTPPSASASNPAPMDGSECGSDSDDSDEDDI